MAREVTRLGRRVEFVFESLRQYAPFGFKLLNVRQDCEDGALFFSLLGGSGHAPAPIDRQELRTVAGGLLVQSRILERSDGLEPRPTHLLGRRRVVVRARTIGRGGSLR